MTFVFGKLLRAGIGFADDKWAYFSHSLLLGDKQHGQVLVKMKFKKGAITVRPGDLIGTELNVKLPGMQAWDQALESM